jgi:hypothetical protein
MCLSILPPGNYLIAINGTQSLAGAMRINAEQTVELVPDVATLLINEMLKKPGE